MILLLVCTHYIYLRVSMQSSPELNIRIKGQKLDMRGSTVNLRDAEGESNTFTSCEFHLFVRELCQGVTVTHLNSPQELVAMTKE